MSEFCFGRKHRLISSADFQAVFRQARYKVSCQHILILAIPNSLSRPRLGLVIGKRHVRQATQRNRIKRLMRESFRHNQHLLTGLDMVILARSGLGELDNAAIHQRMERLLQDLRRRARRSIKPGTGNDHHAG